MDESTEGHWTIQRKVSVVNHGMRDGHMTPRKENYEIQGEKESVNTIIVEIRADDARVRGATRH